MNWFDCLLAFKNVAEQESFIKAADRLGTNNSVITKRIQWLEKRLACTVLFRTTRKITLTEEGDFLLRHINPLLEGWHDVYLQILDFKNQPKGKISICLPPNLSELKLFSNAFSIFLQEYPQLQLSLSTSHRAISLVDEKADILIASEKYLLEPGSTKGIELFKFAHQCFATPHYIKKYGEPKTPEDLKHHNCLIYRCDNQWEFSGKNYLVTGNMRADSANPLILSLLSGAGLIYIPTFVVQEELAKKLIKPVLSKFLGRSDKMMLFYTYYGYKPRKVGIFIDFFKKLIANLKDI